MDSSVFKDLAQRYKQIPSVRTISSDHLTPVIAFERLRALSPVRFLFESVEGIGGMARYSFIGCSPSEIITAKGNTITVEKNGNSTTFSMSIYNYLSQRVDEFAGYTSPHYSGFSGGLVGYLGYETIGAIEDVITFKQKTGIETPDAFFGVFLNLVVFDHHKHCIHIIANADIESSEELEESHNAVEKMLALFEAKLNTVEQAQTQPFHLLEQHYSDLEESDFLNLVERCKQNIFEGDVFQIVLSKRFGAKYQGDLFNVYRALRSINPSPYMYFYEVENNFTVIGTSPEDLLQVKNGRATILPIAGTRKRGKTHEEDLALEVDLLSDTKELAEHTMLVDLARNDLGRFCNYGTVKVTEKMNVHRFSHVMHIVSRVEGEMKEGKNCIDALKASFPAGTVSGAPKIRAIQLLEEYEPCMRNIYAGAVGYIDFRGNLDMCIAIRTLFAKGDELYWQAGAGIVADSVPETELQEIKNKSAVLVNALSKAEVIDASSGD